MKKVPTVKRYARMSCFSQQQPISILKTGVVLVDDDGPALNLLGRKRIPCVQEEITVYNATQFSIV